MNGHTKTAQMNANRSLNNGFYLAELKPIKFWTSKSLENARKDEYLGQS